MTSFTNKYKKHKPCGFCYHVCFDDKLYSQEPVIYRAKSEDEDVAQIFVEVLEETSNALPIMRRISFSKYVVIGPFIGKEGKEVDIKNELRFIDNFNFMASSLDSLVANLSLEKLKETEKVLEDKIH